MGDYPLPALHERAVICYGCDPDQWDHNIGCPLRTGKKREPLPSWLVHHQCGWCANVIIHPCAEATRMEAEGLIKWTD